MFNMLKPSNVFGNEEVQQLLKESEMFEKEGMEGHEKWVLSSPVKSKITEFVHNFFEQCGLNHMLIEILVSVFPTSTSHPDAPYVSVHAVTKAEKKIPKDICIELSKQIKQAFPATKFSSEKDEKEGSCKIRIFLNDNGLKRGEEFKVQGMSGVFKFDCLCRNGAPMFPPAMKNPELVAKHKKENPPCNGECDSNLHLLWDGDYNDIYIDYVISNPVFKR